MSKHQFTSAPQCRMPSPKGDLIVVCAGLRKAHDEDDAVTYGVFTWSSTYDTSKVEGSSDGIAEAIEFNGVLYRMDLFLAVYSDGQVVPNRPTGFELKRTEWLHSARQASESARRKAYEVASDALKEFLATERGEALTRAGLYAQATRDLARLDGEVRTTKEAYDNALSAWREADERAEKYAD